MGQRSLSKRRNAASGEAALRQRCGRETLALTKSVFSKRANFVKAGGEGGWPAIAVRGKLVYDAKALARKAPQTGLRGEMA